MKRWTQKRRLEDPEGWEVEEKRQTEARKAKAREASRIYRLLNREEVNKKAREYSKKNPIPPEKRKPSNAKFYQNHIEYWVGHNAKYYKENTEDMKERSRKWHKENPKRVKESSIRYTEKNREELNRKSRERYQRKKANK